ncbi:hypothetical protein TNCV_2611241 [Trichonephila clavipes]|nr:hypothetical protein TNCV_2611241 [Trichonephila clavipes]
MGQETKNFKIVFGRKRRINRDLRKRRARLMIDAVFKELEDILPAGPPQFQEAPANAPVFSSNELEMAEILASFSEKVVIFHDPQYKNNLESVEEVSSSQTVQKTEEIDWRSTSMETG